VVEQFDAMRHELEQLHRRNIELENMVTLGDFLCDSCSRQVVPAPSSDGCYMFICERCMELKRFSSKDARDGWERTHRAAGC